MAPTFFSFQTPHFIVRAAALLVASVGFGASVEGQQICSGQCFCNESGGVEIAQLVSAVNVALGKHPCPDPPVVLLATGQTSMWGPGSDGVVQAGLELSYTDNGDGTVTDNNTGLMWEKKDDSGGVHDVDNLYAWCASESCDDRGIMDGAITTEFLDTLNDVAGGGADCFAGHCDWRIPNMRELHSIVDFAETFPAVDPAFFRSTTCEACTDITLPTCSCTGSFISYWSSTVTSTTRDLAWAVDFSAGQVLAYPKEEPMRCRAVRRGL